MAGRERATSMTTIHGQTFLPAKLPDIIKRMVPIALKLKKDSYRKILQVIVKDIEGNQITEEVFDRFRESLDGLEEEKILKVYTGLLALLKYAFRHPALKKESFRTELMELRLNNELIEDISKIVFSERHAKIEQKHLEERLNLPSLESLRWRVDVTISTSVLNRVLEPTILMETTDDKGKKATFEVSQKKFHELRYNVAKVMKEMEDLEKRSILKVQD